MGNMATVNDIKKMFDMILEENEYHIILTHKDDEGELVSDVFLSGIETKEVINNIIKQQKEQKRIERESWKRFSEGLDSLHNMGCY